VVWRHNGQQHASRLQVQLLLLAALSLGGCASPIIQGKIEGWGLQNDVHKIDSGDYKSALLAYVFERKNRGYGVFDNNVRNSVKRGNFSLAEEEVAQKAMSSDKQDVSMVWTNKRYGEIKFLPGERYREDGKECRRFSVVWFLTSLGVTKETERGEACINPRTGRWEWV